MCFVHRCIGYMGSKNQDREAIHDAPSRLGGPFSRCYRALRWCFTKPALTFLPKKVVHFKNVSRSCHLSEQRLTPQSPSLTVIRRIDSASLALSLKDLGHACRPSVDAVDVNLS